MASNHLISETTAFSVNQILTMKKYSKNILYFFHVFFAFVFVAHILFIAHSTMNPKIYSTRVSKKFLREIEFPLTFKLCLDELENISRRYNLVGYESVDDFFEGVYSHEELKYGWAAKNNTVLGSIPFY